MPKLAEESTVVYKYEFKDGQYMTALQKKKMCELLKREDHKCLYTLSANHVGVSSTNFEKELQLDPMFKESLEEIEKIWDEWTNHVSILESDSAEGTAAERMFRLKAWKPEKFGDKLNLKHEISEPDPKLLEVIRNVLSGNNPKVKTA